MACAACKRKKKGNGYIEQKSFDVPPFSATDIQIYDSATGELRKWSSSDFVDSRHKLFLFFPETFTPVCQSEMGNLNQWIEEFDKLGVDVYAATTDPGSAVKEWYETEEELRGSKYRVISSYLLAQRLGVTYGSRAKRANVFISTSADVIVQEYPMKVGRSLEELHRMVYAYTTDSYCAEGWKSPKDGFLVKDDSKKDQL